MGTHEVVVTHVLITSFEHSLQGNYYKITCLSLIFHCLIYYFPINTAWTELEIIYYIYYYICRLVVSFKYWSCWSFLFFAVEDVYLRVTRSDGVILTLYPSISLLPIMFECLLKRLTNRTPKKKTFHSGLFPDWSGHRYHLKCDYISQCFHEALNYKFKRLLPVEYWNISQFPNVTSKLNKMSNLYEDNPSRSAAGKGTGTGYCI